MSRPALYRGCRERREGNSKFTKEIGKSGAITVKKLPLTNLSPAREISEEKYRSGFSGQDVWLGLTLDHSRKEKKLSQRQP